MSRSDQYIGLPPNALKFITENVKTTEITKPCPHCGGPIVKSTEDVTEVIGHYSGMFWDEYELLRYHLSDGRTADEFVQAEPWSSGPMFFIGLKISDGTEILWSDEEIDKQR